MAKGIALLIAQKMKKDHGLTDRTATIKRRGSEDGPVYSETWKTDGEDDSESTEPESDESSDLEVLADELISAVHEKDASGVVEALRALHEELCSDD